MHKKVLPQQRAKAIAVESILPNVNGRKLHDRESNYEAAYRMHPEDAAFSEAAIKSWAKTRMRERW